MTPTISTMPALRACPKCGHESEATLVECPLCQVVFAKLREAGQERQRPQVVPEFDYLHQLEDTQDLVIHQVKERLEIFTGMECKNQYRVMNGMGQQLFLAAEQGEGMGELLRRWFLKAARPFTMQLLTPEGSPTIILKRPFRFFFHRIEVSDRNGTLLGHVQMRFSLFRRLYDVVDAATGNVTEIVGPMLRPWTFHITMGGEPVGSITKKWSGLLTEAFTDADNFGVSFPPKTGVRQKALLLGAVFLIDTVHFEDKGWIMPTWGKVVLISAAALMVLLFAAGIILPKLLQAGFARAEQAMEEAQDEGQKMGAHGTLDGCSREAAARSTDCAGLKAVVCLPEVSQFLWACLEAAPYEDEFCAPVPEQSSEAAILSWARYRCRKYGAAAGEECPFILSVVPAFCSTKR